MNIQPLGKGKIIKVGKIELSLKKGDSVYFTKYGPIELKIDGMTYLIIKEEDILKRRYIGNL